MTICTITEHAIYRESMTTIHGIWTVTIHAIGGRSLAILKYAIDDEEYYDIRRLTLDTAKYYAEIDNPVWDLLQQPLESVLDKVVVWAWDTLKGESK